METEHHEHADGVELPTPTAWPMIAALGIMLIALGFITSIVVSMVGFLLGLIGGIGWFRALFPVQSHEFVPFAEPAKRPAAIKVSPRRISHLALGAGGHRAYYPVRVHRYSSGINGGLAGGAAMAVLAMLYGLIFQHSIWYPINLLAAAGLPTMETANAAALNEFHLSAFIIAVLSHGVLGGVRAHGDGDLGQLFRRGAELVHVALGRKGVAAHERVAPQLVEGGRPDRRTGTAPRAELAAHG